MERDPRSYLWDAREAVEQILSFVEGVDLDTYAADELLHSAVERKFEIIGEALNQLSKTSPELAARVTDLPAIVSFRNLLIHGYAVVEHRRVWNTIQQSLPMLRRCLGELLGEDGV